MALLAFSTPSSAQLDDLLGQVSRANAVTVQADGRIVVAGESERLYDYSSDETDLAVVRYAADGTPDGTFGRRGVVITDLGQAQETANALAVQDDGRIVVAGVSGTGAVVVRFLADGSLDPTFGAAGVATPALGELTAVAIQDDGSIVVGGSGIGATSGYFALARLLPDGSPDLSFGAGGIVGPPPVSMEIPVLAIALQPDQKIVAVGGNRDVPSIARFDTGGSFDTTFDGDGVVSVPGFEGAATSVALQDDGRIVVGGRANDSYYSNKIMTVARYLADGSLDATFGGDGVVQPPLYVGLYGVRIGVDVADDGAIVISGDCDYSWIVERFHPDGSLDTSFDIDGISISDLGGNPHYAQTGACAVAVDGESIVTAGHWSYGHNEMIAVTRHTSEGLLDPSFAVDGSLVESDCVRFPVDSSSCLRATSSKLAFAYSDKLDRRAFQWKWQGGETFAQAALGIPDVDTRYTACLYDSAGSQLRLLTWYDVTAGEWTNKSPNGWSFDGGKYGNFDWVSKARLRASDTGGKSSASIRSAGFRDIPTPYPVDGSRYFDSSPSLVLRLVGTNGLCLESSFPSSSVHLNTGKGFKASARQ